MVSLYRADGGQHAWRRVGETFADVNFMDLVARGGGGVVAWATNISADTTMRS